MTKVLFRNILLSVRLIITYYIYVTRYIYKSKNSYMNFLYRRVLWDHLGPLMLISDNLVENSLFMAIPQKCFDQH